MSSQTERAPAAETVRFSYLKSKHFRVVHVDGALGGVTPRGFIHMAVFSERAAIPESAEHSISSQGVLGPPFSQQVNIGIERELDIDMIMSKLTATEVRDWLTEKINELDKLEKMMASRSNNPDV